MRRFLVMLVLPILALAAVGASAETVRIMAGVEVRSYSSPEAPVVGALAKGTVIDVVAREGGWVRIKLPEGGYPGYVPALFCEVVQGVAPYTPPPAPAPSAPPVSVAPAYQPQAAPPASAAPAQQTYTPPAPGPAPAPATYVSDSPQREGFWIGLGLGYGSEKGCDDYFGCGDRQGGLSGYIKLGGTLNPQLLLGVESSGWAKDVEGRTVSVGGLFGTATVYPVVSSGFFLKGGAGLSYFKSEFGSISISKTGWGFIGGLGYDLRVSRNVSITPSFNYIYGNVGDIEIPGLGTSTGNHADLLQFALGVTFH